MSSGDEDSPIPSVNERLGQLRPSRELLEYYRKKVAEFDNEHDEMLKKLDDYRVCRFFSFFYFLICRLFFAILHHIF